MVSHNLNGNEMQAIPSSSTQTTSPTTNILRHTLPVDVAETDHESCSTWVLEMGGCPSSAKCVCLINPRRACAARDMVVGVCVCLLSHI